MCCVVERLKSIERTRESWWIFAVCESVGMHRKYIVGIVIHQIGIGMKCKYILWPHGRIHYFRHSYITCDSRKQNQNNFNSWKMMQVMFILGKRDRWSIQVQTKLLLPISINNCIHKKNDILAVSNVFVLFRHCSVCVCVLWFQQSVMKMWLYL